jgi:soluble lytic murein transglycosylase-like protein
MLQESGGAADAYSASGAVGLLQVMPSDGIAAGFMCANGPCFASRPTTQELLDPAFNIDYGVRYLSGLIQRYGGDTREALRSYGPLNMEYRYADIVLTILENHQ